MQDKDGLPVLEFSSSCPQSSTAQLSCRLRGARNGRLVCTQMLWGCCVWRCRHTRTHVSPLAALCLLGRGVGQPLVTGWAAAETAEGTAMMWGCVCVCTSWLSVG